MACAVSNNGTLSFGTFATAATVTHVRFRKGSDDSNPVVIALSSSVAVAANQQAVIPSGDLEVRYLNGTDGLTNGHMEAIAKAYWENTAMEVDLMTSASVVVSVSGYAQVSHSAWTFTQETD